MHRRRVLGQAFATAGVAGSSTRIERFCRTRSTQRLMPGLNGPRRLATLWDGLSDDQLGQVMGSNVRRIYEESIG